MTGRLHVFPYELLVAWQRAHPGVSLTADQQNEFVVRPICQDIGAYPADMVHAAVRRRTKLTEILDELRRMAAVRAAPSSRAQIQSGDSTGATRLISTSSQTEKCQPPRAAGAGRQNRTVPRSSTCPTAPSRGHHV